MFNILNYEREINLLYGYKDIIILLYILND